MNREVTIRRLDYATEASLLGLLIVLPIAHVTAVRSLLLVITALCWILRISLSGDRRIGTPVDLPIILFGGTVIISVFFAINPALALKEVKGELLTYLMVFYATVYTMRREEHIKRFAVVLSAWIVIFGLVGMAKFAHEGGSFSSMAVRFTSLARGCTNYSDYIVLTLPLTTWAAFCLKGMPAVLGRVAVLVALVTLVYAQARAGWIAVGVELLLILSFVYKRRIAAVLVFFALVVTVFLMPQDIRSHGMKDSLRYDTREQALANGTESVRMYQWTNAVKEMMKHPFKGFGYGRKNYVAGMEAAGPGTLDVSSCNAFLDAWLQLGLQGMAALLVLFASLALTLRRYARQIAINKHMRALFASGAVTVGGYFVVNQFEGSYVDEMAMTFWLLMGVFLGNGVYVSKRVKDCSA